MVIYEGLRSNMACKSCWGSVTTGVRLSRVIGKPGTEIRKCTNVSVFIQVYYKHYLMPLTIIKRTNESFLHQTVTPGEGGLCHVVAFR